MAERQVLLAASFWDASNVYIPLHVRTRYPDHAKDAITVQDILDDLQTDGPPLSDFPQLSPFATITDALETHLQHLEAAPALLRRVMHALNLRLQTWDLPFEIFQDFNVLFFNSMLKGRVHLRWAILPLEVSAKGLGVTQRRRNGQRVQISMRYNLDWSAYERHEMIAVLLHEMLHAYYIIRCGAGSDTPGGHGPLFMRSATKLRALTGLDVAAELRWPNTFELTHVQRNLPFIVEFVGGDAAVTRAEFVTLAFANRYQRQEGTELYVPRSILRPGTEIGF